MKTVFILLLAGMCLGAASAQDKDEVFRNHSTLAAAAAKTVDKVVFQDPFKTMPDGAIPAKEWLARGDAARCFSIKNGELVLQMEPALRRGDSITFPVELVIRGQLDFDAWISGTSYQYGAGLTVKLFGITTFFHAGCRDWRSYYPAPEADRPHEYWDEAPGHQFMSLITPRKWMHCRIIFDRMKDTVEYYLDDMDNPVALHGRVSVWGADEFLGGSLTIANMGQAMSFYETRIKNIVLKSLPAESSAQDIPRERHLLLGGYNAKFNHLKTLLKNQNIKFNDYILTAVNLNDRPRNQLAWEKLPGSNVLKQTKTLLLQDAPAGPDKIMPEAWISILADNVKNGMHLIAAGGLFAFDRGEYKGSGLQKLLPVVYTDNDPVPALNIARGAKISGDEKWTAAFAESADLVINNIAPVKDAKILLNANGKPFVWTKEFGKGRITVIAGNIITDEKNRPEKTKAWDSLMMTLFREKEF